MPLPLLGLAAGIGKALVVGTAKAAAVGAKVGAKAAVSSGKFFAKGGASLARGGARVARQGGRQVVKGAKFFKKKVGGVKRKGGEISKKLKENATNLRDSLKKGNKNQEKLRAKRAERKKKKTSIEKKREKEKELESKKSTSGSKKNILSGLAKSPLSIFNKLFGLGGILLGGILVNAAKGLIDKGKKFMEDNKELFDTIGNFLSGVKDAVVGFFDSITGPASEEGAYDWLGKFGDDGKLTGGILLEVEKAFDGAADIINALDKLSGGKGDVANFLYSDRGQVLAEKGGKEGILDKNTDKFYEKPFTKEERQKYEQTKSGVKPNTVTEGKPDTVTEDKPTNLNDIGDGREDAPVPLSGGILEGARKIIGRGKGIGDQCANTTRAALKEAGHPMANVRTLIGDLDTPRGIAYNAPSFAASFGGTDMGQVIKTKSNIRAGDIILWRADRDLGGILNKGAITHVGIAADDGLKNQFDHNRSKGFHYRRHWNSSGGTSWFAGIRLGSGRGASKMTAATLSTNTEGSGDVRASLAEPKNRSKTNQIASINQPMDDEGGETIFIQRVNTTQYVPVPA